MSSFEQLLGAKTKRKNKTYGTHNEVFQKQIYPRSMSTDSDIPNTNNIESLNLHPSKGNHIPSENRHRFLDVIPYYLPCFIWIPTYSWSKAFHDLIAGVSLASFQIPLALSYATTLAHVEPLCGLYSMAVTPFLYAIFGSVPHMIVGPESALSLVMGQTIEKLISHNDDLNVVNISCVITFIAGLALLISGICRVGFLESVLSRALLRGFISSIGFVMVINSLISELKLNQLLLEAPGHHHTAFGKILFLFKYGPKNYHKATAIVSLCCFTVLMIIRFAKKKMSKAYKWIVLFPEILLVIIIAIYLSAKLKFKEKYGIAIIGDFNTNGLGWPLNPVSKENTSLFSSLHSVGIVVALLGFFESTTASKSLGGINNSTVSSNRELVAMGIMNIVASLFGALPSFGGYGRSKINAMSGAQTVMSGVFLGLITLFTIQFLLPTIKYIPTCVLSVITTIVGISLLEETPSEIRFHILCHGYNELIVFALTFLATIFYSVDVGITIGCAYSVISIIRRSAKSRIQILAKIEGVDHFVNADEYQKNNSLLSPNSSNIKYFEGSLVVKIPEPLTFSNTEDLKERLDRLERFGSANVHPGTRDTRSRDTIKYVIFDLKGMTFIDSSAAQILKEIVSDYNDRGVEVFLTRVPFNKEIRFRLSKSGITDIIVNFRKSNLNDKSFNPSIRDDHNSSTDEPFFLTIEEALFRIESTNMLNP